MDDVDTSYVRQSERMGHEVPGMRGVYSHVTPRMRTRLVNALQEMWEASLIERAALSPRSLVPTLDTLLAATGRPTGARNQDRLPGPLPESDITRCGP
jgi:hypothetical protein